MPNSPSKMQNRNLHIIVRGINRQDIFHDDEDRKRYLGPISKKPITLRIGCSTVQIDCEAAFSYNLFFLLS